jgi:hypothetical protein
MAQAGEAQNPEFKLQYHQKQQQKVGYVCSRITIKTFF